MQKEEAGIFTEFMHQPFWNNQSQVVYENSDNHGNVIHSESNLVADYKDAASARKILTKLASSDLQQPGISATIKRTSSSRNDYKT